MESPDRQLSVSSTSDLTFEEALIEIQRLESEKTQLHTELEECKDHLFELLQKNNDIPEQTVKDAFIQFQAGVESWIDDVSGDKRFDFMDHYHRNVQSTDRRSAFDKLVQGPECSDTNWQVSLKGEACYYPILSLVIAGWLVDKVFISKGRYPFGLSEHQVEFVRTVESAMSMLDADSGKFAKWRGQTITCLAETKEFQTSKDDQSRTSSNNLRGDLEVWLGSRLLSEHFPDLQKKVIKPAIDLLHLIGCSSKTYEFSQSWQDVSRWSYKDVESWRTLSANNVLGYICPLYPGLVRKGAGNGVDDLLLVKPVGIGYQNVKFRPVSRSKTKPERARSDFSTTESIRAERGMSEPSRQGRRSGKQH